MYGVYNFLSVESHGFNRVIFIFMVKSISIIIPNYNGKTLLMQNLPSVFNALKTSNITDYEIIVTDDASQDDSVLFLKNEYAGRVLVLENPNNVGFAGNVNRGIFKAQKDLVFILNSDVQLTEGFFLPLLKYFEYPDTFGVMSRIDNFQNYTIDQAKYPEIHFAKIDGTRNFYNPNVLLHYTLFLSGANALIDKNKLLELGGFLEIFCPFYYEDVDLGLRAWRKGFKCYYENNAVCLHDVSSSIKKKLKKDVLKVILKNKIYLHFLHLSSAGFGFFILKFLGKVLWNSVHLNKVYWFALREFIKNYSEIIHIRKKLQQSEKINLMEIKNIILNSL